MSIISRPELRPTTIAPRPYQVEAIGKVFDRFRKGDRSTLAVLPTGTGKTSLAGCMIRKGVEHGRRTLWLTHRTDLATQSINHLERHGLDPQREQAECSARAFVDEPDVVVGMVQTLTPKRLKSWPRDYFNLLVCDEAHHFVSDQFRAPVDYFGSAKVVGLTATPGRGDGKNLGEVFDSVADERDIWWAWKDPKGPYLCPLEVIRRDVGFDISQLRIDGASDYSADELAMMLEPLVEPVANVVLDEVGDRQTLVYVPRVAVAQALATALQVLGMAAEWIAGNDPDRVSKMGRFASGELQVLVNADLLGEGNDLPNVGAIVDAYPTRSRVRYTQRVGRGLRPDTPNCLLVCLASNYQDSRLVTPADLVPQARYNDGIADWIDALLEDEDGPSNLMDAVEEARKKERSEPTPPRVIRCRARRYQVGGRRTVFRPTDAADILGCSAEYEIARPPRNAVIHRLTDKQRAILERAKIKDVGRLSSRQASKLIEKIFDRKDQGLASLPQVQLLISKGVDPHVARSMGFSEASQELDRLLGKK